MYIELRDRTMTWLQAQSLFQKKAWVPTFEKGANAPGVSWYKPGDRFFINHGSMPAIEKLIGEPSPLFREENHIYYARVTFSTHEEAIALFEKLHKGVQQFLPLRPLFDLDIQIQPKKIQIETPDVRLFRLLTNIWVRDPSVYCGYIEMNCDRYNIRKWLVRSPLRR
jgi:hypothetical protein